jgi:hypothetical protein
LNEEADRLGLREIPEPSSAASIWQWFVDEFEGTGAWSPAEPGGEPMAALTLRLLHWRLRRFDSGYNLALDLAHLPRALAPADALWQPLYRSAGLAAGLLSVHQGHRAELPEEPRGDTVLLNVSGVVTIADDADPRCAGRRLEPGAFACCREPRARLGLEAASVVAVLLVVLPIPGRWSPPDLGRRAGYSCG